MATSVKTCARVKFTFGMGTVIATIANKVWTVEAESDTDPRFPSMVERMLQAGVDEDIPMSPLDAESIDNGCAIKAAERHNGSILSLNPNPYAGKPFSSQDELAVF